MIRARAKFNSSKKFVVFSYDLLRMGGMQGRSQEFDLGGYKWVKETKEPHKII